MEVDTQVTMDAMHSPAHHCSEHGSLAAGCQLTPYQPPRSPCAALCVCASTGLTTASDIPRPAQLGQSLTDHSGTTGGTAAAPSSRLQSGPLSAVATLDAEVSA